MSYRGETESFCGDSPAYTLAEATVLGSYLEALWADHGRSAMRSHDYSMGQKALASYSVPPEEVVTEFVRPFLTNEAELVASIYREHRFIPISEYLDTFEGLLLLERLAAEPDLVFDSWNLDDEEIENLAATVGVRVAA